MSDPLIDVDGNSHWLNAKGKWCRNDGPAIIYADGEKSWWVNGKRCESNTEFQEAANITDEDMTAIILKYGNIE